MMQNYFELRCRSHYSFLKGSSHPKELIDRASELGLSGLAMTDLNGVYGLPKAYLATKSHPGFKLICGAQIKLKNLPLLTLLAQNRAAYGLLCRILTELHRG